MSTTNEQQLTEIKVNVDQVETTTTMVDSKTVQNQQIIRNELVDVAVKFLQNPKVGQTSLDHRKKFLQSKGLTDIEIAEAIKRSSLTQVITQTPPYVPAPPVNYVLQQAPSSTFARIKDTLESVALLSGLMYGLYLFYKRFIYPYLFGKKPPTPRVDPQAANKKIMDELTIMKTTNQQITEQLQQVSKQLNEKVVIDRQLEEIKSEMSSIKSLLLSKKHFPSVPDSCVVVHPPSIPAWQLQASTAANEPGPDDLTESDNSADIIEMGSGTNSAGSSETEIISNRG